MKYRMKKFLVRTVVVLFILVLAVTIGASFYMLDFALSPQRRTHDEAMTRLYKREPANIKTWVKSIEKRQALHDTTITVPERGNLKAIYLRSDKPTNRTAVLLHGYNDRAESMLHIAYLYNYILGYNVLMPHCFAHGDSDGDHIDMGWRDRLDAMQWMQLANDMFRGDSAQTQMVVHGISMGGFATMCISGEECPPYVKCFVEDCGYTSVWDEFSSELHNEFSLPEFPLLYSTSALCKMRYGWTFGEASAVKQLKKSTLPMLFIHGDADTFVPYAMLDTLYAAKTTGYKEKFIAHSTTHARSFTRHQREYISHVKKFVKRFIK